MSEYPKPHAHDGVEIDHRHVDESEVVDAFAQAEPVEDDSPVNGVMPTRKWIAARITALATILVLFQAHGWHFDEHTIIALGGFLAEAVISWSVSNAKTPGGVPDAG